MLIETKTLWVPGYECPSNDDIDEAYERAKRDNCRVNLCWKGPDNKYYGGYHSRFIDPDTDIEEIKKSIRGIVYGL